MPKAFAYTVSQEPSAMQKVTIYHADDCGPPLSRMWPCDSQSIILLQMTQRMHDCVLAVAARAADSWRLLTITKEKLLETNSYFISGKFGTIFNAVVCMYACIRKVQPKQSRVGARRPY